MVILLEIQELQRALLSVTKVQAPMMLLGVRISLNQRIFIYKWSTVPCKIFSELCFLCAKLFVGS